MERPDPYLLRRKHDVGRLSRLRLPQSNLGGTGNTNFTGQAGQLRTIWTLNGYLIEGDVNGDAKPDFQIEVLNVGHDISWNAVQADYFVLV